MAIQQLNTESIPVISFFDLTDDQQTDMIDVFGGDLAADSNYFIYEGLCYCMAECLREESHTEAGAAGWHGYFGESNTSRVLVRLVDDNEAVILGRES